jgi:hypothetical protein
MIKIMLNLNFVLACLSYISWADCLILDKVFLSLDLRKFLADCAAVISQVLEPNL